MADHDTELYPFAYPPNQKKDYQPTESHSSKKFSSEIRRVPYVPKNSINGNSSGSVKTPTTRYFYSLAFVITLLSMITVNINPRESIDIAFHHLVPSRIPETSAHETEEPIKNFNNALRDLGTATNIFDSISELEQQSLPINWPNIEDHFQCTKLKTPGSTTSLIPQMMSDIHLQLSNMRGTLGQVNGKGKQALQMFVEGPMGPKFAKGLLGSLLIQLETILKKNIIFLSEVETASKLSFEFKTLLHEHKIYAKVVPKKSWIKRLRPSVFNPHHDDLHLQCRILVSEVVDKTLAFLQDTKKVLVVYNGNMESLLELIKSNSNIEDEPKIQFFHEIVALEMVFKSIMEKGWFNVGKGVLQPASIGH
ncbi:hypothetical protein Pst134EB_023823 [Puccinia striiformis f. sp. tritici]|nr:hypothetical protein Pst134EB_023823 [Puccinia striiformis f. sp. tritici]